jgi:hypothetical protein
MLRRPINTRKTTPDPDVKLNANLSEPPPLSRSKLSKEARLRISLFEGNSFTGALDARLEGWNPESRL